MDSNFASIVSPGRECDLLGSEKEEDANGGVEDANVLAVPGDNETLSRLDRTGSGWIFGT